MGEPSNNSSVVVNIPVDEAGKVNLQTDEFLLRVQAENRAIVFGDSNHNDPAIRQWVADCIRTLKKGGTTDVFLEMPQWQDAMDRFNATSDEGVFKLIKANIGNGFPDKDHELNIEKLIAICRECRNNGIKVHGMDVPILSSPLPMPGESGKDYKDRYEKGRVGFNQQWVDYIAETMKGRDQDNFAVFCGLGHIENSTQNSPSHYFDQMLAQKMGKTACIAVYQNTESSPVIGDGRKDNIPLSLYKGKARDAHGFVVVVPSIHIEEALKQEHFRQLPDTDQKSALKALDSFGKTWADLHKFVAAQSGDQGFKVKRAFTGKIGSIYNAMSRLKYSDVREALEDIRKEALEGELKDSKSCEPILNFLGELETELATVQKYIPEKTDPDRATGVLHGIKLSSGDNGEIEVPGVPLQSKKAPTTRPVPPR